MFFKSETRTSNMNQLIRTPSRMPGRRTSVQSPPPAPRKPGHPRDTVVSSPIPIPGTFQDVEPAPKEKKE